MVQKQCYCAFCRSPRRRPPQRRISLWNLLGLLGLAMLVNGLIAHEVDGRSLLLFVSFLFIAEWLLQLRWRVSLVCKECGFDPVIYLREPGRAAENVRAHLEARSRSPMSLFRKNAKLALPRRRVQTAAAARS